MIRCRNISKQFQEGGRALQILSEVDLDIEAGEFVSIVGKSGSGKSTLISLLAGLDHPSSGELEVDSHRLDQLSENDLVDFRRRSVGFVFQSFNLIPTLSALENVAVPAQLAGDSEALPKAHSLLEQVGLKERLHHFPSQMSGGEQQRVSVCRALVNNPRILFADEPTGNLDTQSGEKVLDLIFQMRGERTLVIVTHDEELAARADRMIEIKDGRIQDGRHHQARLERTLV